VEAITEMDLEKAFNPYDFANPVCLTDLFAGRKTELSDILYYLNHAKQASHPINIAILGQRASGKTSLLNMMDLEAKKRDFCVARIDLDEGDAESQLAFFYKIFDAILTSACELGAFGGLYEKTYQTYLAMTNTYCIPEDTTFCSFLFPFQYAHAMRRGNIGIQISDQSLKKDLKKIYQELKCPTGIFFDEGNVLTKNRILLEKLRNLFMNLPGYMLVLTGTPDLFPIIDDIFSPLVRQFKKINLSGFKTINETEECITNPLDKYNIPPEDLIDRRLIQEIHKLSGGRPYEIQLICHFLFRQVQQKQNKKLILNFRALEEIRRELIQSTDLQERTMVNNINSLDERDLTALNLLVPCNGHAKFEYLWYIQYIFFGYRNWTKNSLRTQLDRLISLGIMKENDDIIQFNGDEFDKIYIKYFAREKNVNLLFSDMPLEIFWDLHLRAHLSDFGDIEPLNMLSLSGDSQNILKVAVDMANMSLPIDIFSDGPPLVEELYKIMVRNTSKETLPLLTIFLSLPWLNVHSWFCLSSYTSDFSDCIKQLDILEKRVIEVGGELLTKIESIPIAPIEILKEKIKKTANEKLKRDLLEYHADILTEGYIRDQDAKKALFHACFVEEYGSDFLPIEFSNNVAYIFLLNNKVGSAKDILIKSIDSSKSHSMMPLLQYNLAIAELLSGNLNNAIANLKECNDNLEKNNEKEKSCFSLLVPVIENGIIDLTENINRPNLFNQASIIISLLESLNDSDMKVS
jgi:hypothetical protein